MSALQSLSAPTCPYLPLVHSFTCWEAADKMNEESCKRTSKGRICRKCKAHGKINSLKNYHRTRCEFKECDCKSCSLVTRTRERSKFVLQTKRRMEKERRLSEKRTVAILPAEFHPNLHKGMPVACNCQSPWLLLSPANQQSVAHFAQFQTYVTNMTRLVARILQQTATSQEIPRNLYNLVAKTFYPSWPLSPPISGPTDGHYSTTSGESMDPVTRFVQPMPVNTVQRFAPNWAVGLPQTCSCPRCTSFMYLAIPNQDVPSVQQL